MTLIEQSKPDAKAFIESLPNTVEDLDMRVFFIKLGLAVLLIEQINATFYIGDFAAIAQESNVKYDSRVVDTAIVQMLFNHALGDNIKFVAGYFEFIKCGTNSHPQYRCTVHDKNWNSFIEFYESTQITNQTKGLVCMT
jgi:hypothetical protein